MSVMRPIEIDFEVHKAIEGERRSFDEAPNDVLRRLIGIKTSIRTSPPIVASGKAWSGKGVVLPHGTELKMDYNGIEYGGKIDDGRWACGGGLHAGPSPAAAAVATTRHGTKPSLNGWIYWMTKLPGSSRWVPISTLRKH